MSLRLLPTAALLALLATPAILHAQAEISSSEELRLEALAREQAETYSPRNSITIGFRMLSSGARVKYTNLGSVPMGSPFIPISAGAVARQYDDGLVGVDAPRPNEKDLDGIQVSTPGGRYQTTQTVPIGTADADGNVIGVTNTTEVNGDYLSYTPGLTRIWTYVTPEQIAVRPGYIAMNNYSTSSDGASAMHKQGPVGGIELQFAHSFGKATNRVQWSVLTGITMNDINNKVTADVSATLHTNTDFYSLHGLTAPPLPTTTDATTGAVTTSAYDAPSYTDLLDASGNVITTNGLETTVPISDVPVDQITTIGAPGSVIVHGRWQIKGAYYMVKLGPALRAQLTDHLSINASLGAAGAFAGTHYTVTESFVIPNVGNTVTTPITEQSETSKFLGGYYADLNLDWATNDTTGLFGGITAQRLGSFDQNVGGRIAHVDVGSAVGLRGGVSIKF
jgi:hypothetical protein